MREDDAAMKAERNAQRRMEDMHKKANTGNSKAMKILEDASRTKEESLKNAISINKQREAEAHKNSSIKEMIRRQKADAEERRAMEQAEKRQAARNRLINSILEENAKRMDIESKVADLEKQEYELIQRLQNTSNIQKQAYEDLESALNGNISPEQLEA